MTATIVQQAHALSQAGNGGQAVALLQQAIGQGQAEAMLMLGLWQIEGRILQRDLPAARFHIGRASTLGLASAARIEAALLATGVGSTPDWQGALALLRQWGPPDPIAAHQLALIDAMAIDANGDPTRSFVLEPLSSEIEIHRIAGLFTAAECAFLIGQGSPRFRPARIFHDGTQRFQTDPVRDSETAGFPLIFENPVVHALNRRIARATATNVAQGESLQLLRYAAGQQYKLHIDAIPGLANQRIKTALVYLNDDFVGGATSFPAAGLAHRGGMGDALIFTNVLPDNSPDPATRHMGEAVTLGTKIVASRWIRQRPPPAGEAFGPHEAMPTAA